MVDLVRFCEKVVPLDLEYPLPPKHIHTSSNIRRKTTVVQIRRSEADNLGLTIRGGIQSDSKMSRPITVTRVRPNSPADKCGIIRPGDRILRVNTVSTVNLPLNEVVDLLRLRFEEDSFIELLLEYDVSIVTAILESKAQVLLEIEKNPGVILGVELSKIMYGTSPRFRVERVCD